jgi:multiple sugar transport system substrate-binding protein
MRPQRTDRRVALLALVVTPALALGAVGGVAAQESQPPRVDIRFTWWGNRQRGELTNAQVDLFEAAYPWIHVQTEPTVFDGYFDKRATEFAAGTAPDVITLGGAYPIEYGAAGQLLDLRTVADTVGLAEYAPNAYAAATIGDRVFGLPTGGNTLGLFVNMDLLSAAGGTLPDDAWTWSQFIEWAGELATQLPEGVYATDWRIAEVKGPYASQQGTPLYTAEGQVGLTEATVQSLFDIPLALIANDGMPFAEITASLRNTQLEQTLFGQARAVTMAAYSNQLQAFHDLLGADVAIVKLPGETAESPGLTVRPSQSFGIYANSAAPTEAAMLVDWLLNEPEPQKIILGNRGLSFNPAILEAITPLLAEYDAKSAEYLARISVEGGPYIAPAAGSSEVDELWLRTEDEVLFDQVSPAEAAVALVREAKDIVTEASNA